MKKITLCLIGVCFLSACDKINNTPDCWDDDIKKQILEETTYTNTDDDVNSATFNKDITYKVKNIVKMYEINKEKKCYATILFEDGKVHTAYYDTMWIKNEKNKKEARYYRLTE